MLVGPADRRYACHVGSREAAIYTLRLLGAGLVEGPDGPVDGRLARPRPLALLAVLAMAGDRGCTRDRLVGLFWGEANTRHARHSLSDVLHSIHRELGPAVTLAAGDVVRLNGAAVEADAVRFERAAERGDLERAVALYAGPFMEGFHLSGSAAFTEWQEAERRRLAARYAGALEGLAHAAEGHRDLAGAARWWGRRLELDRYCTHAALAMATALAESGERAAALRVLTRHIDAVRNELEVEPDAEVLRVIERVRGPGPPGEPTRRPARDIDPRPPVAVLPALSGRGTSAAKRGGGSPGAARGAPTGRGRRGRHAMAVAAGVAIVAGLGWGWSAWSARSHTLIGEGAIARGGRVLLADFQNRSDDPTLADAVRLGLRALLTDPRLVRLMDRTAVREGLARMGRLPETTLDEATARDLAEREGAQAYVTGVIDRLGRGYQFTVRVVGAVDGRELLLERVTADDEAGVIDAVDRLGARVRRRIGESLREAVARPSLARVSTPSLPALRALSAAWREETGPQAIALAREAIALDSGFASAYVTLGRALESMSRSEEARLAYDTAYQLRGRLPEWERLMVESAYYARHLQPEGRERTLLQVLALEPSNSRALVNLSDLRLTQRRFAEAESLAVRALDLGFIRGIAFFNALEAQLAQGRGAAAESLLMQAPPERRRGLEPMVRLAVRDWDAARAELESVGDAHHLRVLQALHGKLSLDERPLGTELRWWPLQLLRYTGDTLRAFRALRAWRARIGWDTLPPAARPYWILIPTLAEGGRVHEARGMLDEWRTLVPDDPRHRSDEDWGLGAIALAEGRLDSATAAFLAWNNAPFAEDIHRYNRGLIEAATAFDRAGRADTAIALYEHALAMWTLDGVHYEATWYPVVLQRLGQLHESLGHAEQATGYYGQFIELWNDADADLQPRVRETRMTLARLAGSAADRPGR